jgi:hypothetical protein
MKAVADTLGVSRSNLHDKVRRASKPRCSYRKPDDDELLPLIRRLADERPTYAIAASRRWPTGSWPGRVSRRSTTWPNRVRAFEGKVAPRLKPRSMR